MSEPVEFTVDFNKVQGTIRPLHGINGGPLCYRGMVDLTAFHRDLAIPLTRLHDVPWVNAEAVDIHTIFRDFSNDPSKPENYFFGPTDDYLKAVVQTGAKIVYRLGESIEHTPRQYWVHPPSDLQRWAEICLGIIRHCNEGWGEGHRFDIGYWEIWNEPDVRPNMWTGPDRQFFQLFETAAKTIKKSFPKLKVGGPGLGHTGSFVGDRFDPAPFFTNFLAHCQTTGTPLDFFSWHRYSSNAWDLPRRARAVRQVLDQCGFAETESHLNEWNYLPNEDWRPMLREGQGLLREKWCEEMGGPAAAAFAAAGLVLLQDAPIAAANFYTGEIQCFGLFNFHGSPRKTFWAFKAFQQLLETPHRAAVSEVRCPTAVAAGTADGKETILVALPGSGAARVRTAVKLPIGRKYAIRAVDAEHSLEVIAGGETEAGESTIELECVAPAVLLFQFSAKPQR